MRNRRPVGDCYKLKQTMERRRLFQDNHPADCGIPLLTIEVDAAGNRHAALILAIPIEAIVFGSKSLADIQRRDRSANDVVDGDWQW